MCRGLKNHNGVHCPIHRVYLISATNVDTIINTITNYENTKVKSMTGPHDEWIGMPLYISTDQLKPVCSLPGKFAEQHYHINNLYGCDNRDISDNPESERRHGMNNVDVLLNNALTHWHPWVSW
jgi:hypothetical protein